MLVCWTWRLSGIYFSDHVESRQQATNQDQDKEHRRTILGWESTSKNHSWTRKHGRFRELVKNLILFLTRWLEKKCFPCMPTNWQARAAWNYGLHAVCGGLVALAPYWAPWGVYWETLPGGSGRWGCLGLSQVGWDWSVHQAEIFSAKGRVQPEFDVTQVSYQQLL